MTLCPDCHLYRSLRPALVNFQETRVLQRRLISSTNLVSINKSKLMACGFVAFLSGPLLSSVPWSSGQTCHQPFSQICAGISNNFLLALSMAFLASVIIGNNRFLYSGLSTVLGLGLSFTSEVFVP